jgi:arylformamidase
MKGAGMAVPRSIQGLLSCLLILTLVSAAGAQPAAPGARTTSRASRSEATSRPESWPVVAPGCRILWNVSYVEGGGAQQKLDVYAPVGVKAAPVILFVHGGEWTKGDKSEVNCKPKFFNDQGMVFVSINYRLSGTAKHPAQVDDVAAAVRWVRDHAVEFGGDPRRLVLMGHSAGCHLVTLVGLDPRPLAKVNLKPSDLRAIVSWSGGAFDLPDKVRSGGMYADYIRLNFGEDEGAWRDASPMTHAAEAKPTPMFLFASAQDGNPGSRVASEKMVSLIGQAGGNARSVVLKGKTHFTANHEVGMRGDETGGTLVRFVREATGADPRGD